MGRHRVRLDEQIARLPEGAYESIRDTPLRYDPLAAEPRCFEGRDLPPDATAAEVLDTAVQFDECLVNLYRQVLQQDVDRAIEDLFEALLQAEQQDEIELKKIKALDYF